MPDRESSPGHSDLSECPLFLSKRQTEVLALVARGLTDADIARRLDRSIWTIRAHLAEARRRLGALNTCHAVAIAMAWRLIDIDIFLAKAA